MKIYTVLFITFFSLTTNTFSQIRFTPHTITTSADFPNSVFAADMYGDGDIDVLSASAGDNKIAWYENMTSPVTGVHFSAHGVPQQFILKNNYPNPFNPATTIAYELPEAAYVVLKIYNVLGREVRTLLNGHQQPGVKSVVWDGRNALGIKVSSGVFVYRLQDGFELSPRESVLILKTVRLYYSQSLEPDGGRVSLWMLAKDASVA